jgi:hypothetical protein
MLALVFATADVLPLVFAGVVLVTFLILMVDLSTGRKRREAREPRRTPRSKQARSEHAYQAAPRAPYRY